MIKRVTYECEHCHNHYLTPGEAETCEAIHVLPDAEQIEYEYRTNEEYPRRVILHFPDGKKAVYDIRNL